MSRFLSAFTISIALLASGAQAETQTETHAQAETQTVGWRDLAHAREVANDPYHQLNQDQSQLMLDFMAISAHFAKDQRDNYLPALNTLSPLSSVDFSQGSYPYAEQLNAYLAQASEVNAKLDVAIEAEQDPAKLAQVIQATNKSLDAIAALSPRLEQFKHGSDKYLDKKERIKQPKYAAAFTVGNTLVDAVPAYQAQQQALLAKAKKLKAQLAHNL
ncbi:hypothetical protein SHLO109777_08045 [Shewanella loihica]|uniref:Uncharacterized protein n=1 Tax=Shewanella loihica (strain ATCC BAA-1088 / PV-4) TaxID=323850 RepID=A3QI06_SHELP|nr:hypothetical protein [Shewanella loihica]ABO25104.1 hypothetical protein Shew_3238 [Shewanella loihica PV-4]